MPKIISEELSFESIVKRLKLFFSKLDDELTEYDNKHGSTNGKSRTRSKITDNSFKC